MGVLSFSFLTKYDKNKKDLAKLVTLNNIVLYLIVRKYFDKYKKIEKVAEELRRLFSPNRFTKDEEGTEEYQKAKRDIINAYGIDESKIKETIAYIDLVLRYEYYLLDKEEEDDTLIFFDEKENEIEVIETRELINGEKFLGYTIISEEESITPFLFYFHIFNENPYLSSRVPQIMNIRSISGDLIIEGQVLIELLNDLNNCKNVLRSNHN